MMKVEYKNYTVELADEANYSLNSVDNIVHYNLEYFDGHANDDRVYPTAKYGIRINGDSNELASAIICEVGGTLSIQTCSFTIKDDAILICCYDKVYSLGIPGLNLNWKKRLDPAICIGIYPFKDDFIVHGELQVTRIDINGNVLWEFGARDIFVTLEGKGPFEISGDRIKLRDFEGYEYVLDENGQEV